MSYLGYTPNSIGGREKRRGGEEEGMTRYNSQEIYHIVKMQN
jgi:hypothetical protein